MTRLALSAALALSLTSFAEAGKPFNVRVGGVQVHLAGHRGGGVKVSLPTTRPPRFKPPVGAPPVIVPPIIKPVPPIACPPPVILPKPPIVITPPVVLPKPPIAITPPVVLPKPPIVCPPPVILPKPPIVVPPVIKPVPPVVCPPVVVNPPAPPVVCPPPVLKPVCPTLPCGCETTCVCNTQPEWRFGMACERVQTQFGVGMRVTLVTPGGAAQTAGLQPGDVLLVAGSTNLAVAASNEHGVELIQAAVPEEGILPLTIVDASTGLLGQRTLAPERIVVTPPAPTAVALNPAEPSAAL